MWEILEHPMTVRPVNNLGAVVGDSVGWNNPEHFTHRIYI